MATNVPVPAVGSYQRYKNDTEIFMTWVSQAAQACGYTSASGRNQTQQPSSVTPKSSNNIREKNSIPVKEILIQAKAIVGTITPFIRLPASIERAAQNAIHMRKEFTARFLELGVDLGESNARHLYFVDVLQQALGLLQGRNSRSKETTEHSSRTTSEDLISNRFALLEVEDFEDAESVASHFEKSSKTTKSTSHDAPRIVTPDCSKDADMFLEMILSVFCFFDDLHQIQNHLQTIWREHKNGQRDLMAATLITNTALSLVEHAEEELISSWPEIQTYKFFKPDPEYSYQGLVSFFRPEEWSKKDDTFGHLAEIFEPEASLNALGDYIYVDSFWTVKKYARSLKHDAKDNAKLPFPRIPRLAMDCRNSRRLFDNAKFKSRDEEDESFTQLLIDTFFNMDRVKEANVRQLPRLAVVDEFTKAMMKIEEFKLTAHTVFAATVMKDIHRILGTDITKSHNEMMALAEECQRLIWHATPQAPRGLGPYWRGEDTEFLGNIMGISNYVLTWPIGSDKSKAFELATTLAPGYDLLPIANEIPNWAWNDEARKAVEDITDHRRLDKWSKFAKPLMEMGIKYVFPAEDPLLVYRGNPLLCGTMMLNLTLVKEQAGIALANHQLSVLHTSYLYNALQQKSLLPGSWPLLEKAMNSHVDSLFFGARPTTPEDTTKKYWLRLGLNASHRKALERTNSTVGVFVASVGGDGTARKGISPSCLSISETSKILAPYFDGKRSMLRTSHSINSLIQKSKSGSTRAKPKYTLDPLQFLVNDLPDWLSKVVPIITTDYITLTRRCNELLQSLIDSKSIAFKHAAPDPKRDGPDCSINNNFVHIVLHTLRENRNYKVATKSDLEIAGMQVEKYLRKKELLAETSKPKTNRT